MKGARRAPSKTTATRSRRAVVALAWLIGLAGLAPAARAQKAVPPSAVDARDSLFASDTSSSARLVWATPINVTATRTRTDVFLTPAAVTVLDRADIREKAPDTVTDLFRDVPGLDVNGVGPNQTRPTIRGQRGQRILLLEDGMRLNNTRRQQDFGEIPGLVDVAVVQRVEVVRGPASVLYGSDAIGGVVNVITRVPEKEGLGGVVRYRYSTHDAQSKIETTVSGRSGRIGVLASGTYRDADSYDAPQGTFGDISLDGRTEVRDSGVRDDNLYLHLGVDLASDRRGFAKYERYHADDAGFGYVDPADYAPSAPFIRITYPFQTFDKVTLGYQDEALSTVLADRLEALTYWQGNERQFNLDVDVPLGPSAPPGASIAVHSENHTDLSTFGLRVEAKKRAADRHLLTYGVDLFRDDSKNSDFSRTTMTGFGPPMTIESRVPQVPNAVLRNVGAFVQDEIGLTPRATVIVGARYQDIRAETRPTDGIEADPVENADRTVVAAANGVYELTPALALVASVGRGFRAPNLVERYFEGPTPEGGSFQTPNPDLVPETSLDTDLGMRFRGGRLYAEGFVFRNKIRDGIRIAPTGETIQGLPEYRNVNVDELLFRGVELSADVLFLSGVTVGGSYTYIDSQDVNDPENPVGESFSSKAVADLGYRDPLDRYWIEYSVRHEGERDDATLVDNPIGSVLPAFTVHAVRGGVRLYRGRSITQRVEVAVDNLTNELYAEFANASFFRPAPGRSLRVVWDLEF